MNAYNYQTQQWESGNAAQVTRKAQVVEELGLLRGPQGKQYAQFVGLGDPAVAIARLEKELAGMEVNA